MCIYIYILYTYYTCLKQMRMIIHTQSLCCTWLLMYGQETDDRAKSCVHIGISVADAQELSGFLLNNFEPQGSSLFSSYALWTDHGHVPALWKSNGGPVAPEAQPRNIEA